MEIFFGINTAALARIVESVPALVREWLGSDKLAVALAAKYQCLFNLDNYRRAVLITLKSTAVTLYRTVYHHTNHGGRSVD